MATAAQLAQGMTIDWGSTHVAEVTNFDLGFSVDEVDVTNHDSADNSREFIAALKSPQEVSFTVNWVTADHSAFYDAIGDSTNVQTLTIDLADASDTFSVSAWVKGVTIHGPATGEALTADLVFRTTGAVSHTGS